MAAHWADWLVDGSAAHSVVSMATLMAERWVGVRADYSVAWLGNQRVVLSVVSTAAHWVGWSADDLVAYSAASMAKLLAESWADERADCSAVL